MEQWSGLTKADGEETCFVCDKTLADTDYAPDESQSGEPYLWVEAFQAVG